MEEVIVNKYGINSSLREYTDYSNFCIEHQCFGKLSFKVWKRGYIEYDDHFMFGQSFWEEAKKKHESKYWSIPFDIMYLTIAGELPSPVIINK